LRSVIAKWDQLRRLTRSERRLFAKALLLLPLIDLGLRLGGFRRCQLALARFSPVNGADLPDRAEAMMLQARAAARMVRVAARYGPYRATCLQQALTLWWLLRRQGIASDLCFGARKEADQVEAHAWVELQGVALGEAEDIHQRFAPFDRAIVPMEVRPK
jgi:hypothetical protein